MKRAAVFIPKIRECAPILGRKTVKIIDFGGIYHPLLREAFGQSRRIIYKLNTSQREKRT